MKTMNSFGMTFALIPKGTFMMGSPATEAGRSSNETQHPVTLTKAFYLGIHEVTQENYQMVLGTNPSGFEGPQNPVDSVSWQDAVEYCRKLSEAPDEKEAGRVYRLPTEAEWEYACRAGTTTAASFGNDDSLTDIYAWHSLNSRRKSQPVGQKKSNPWGLHDMHGNVWEWCQDWYGEYPTDKAVDPLGPPMGSARVHRGHCCFDIAERIRSSVRHKSEPSREGKGIGFRVVLELNGNGQQ